MGTVVKLKDYRRRSTLKSSTLPARCSSRRPSASLRSPIPIVEKVARLHHRSPRAAAVVEAAVDDILKRLGG